MTTSREGRSLGARSLLVYPGLMLVGLFVAPLLVIAAVSLFERDPAGFFEPVFTLANYRRALAPFYLERLAVSVGFASLAALACVVVGFPFAYLLARRPRKAQVPYLVLILSVLSLSEVIVAFAWSLLLSRTSGLSNLLVFLGVLDAPVAWTPGFTAALLGFVFLAFPLTVLTFYPTVSRLNPELVEAATTMGASPVRGFFTVVVPVMRQAIAGAFVLMFVFLSGAYLVPQVLGRPAQWTLPVHVTDQAVMQSHLPLAAALAIVLLAASAMVALIGLLLAGPRVREVS
jgi:putative spermidine/putrescine transport system permease protein